MLRMKVAYTYDSGEMRYWSYAIQQSLFDLLETLLVDSFEAVVIGQKFRFRDFDGI
jgi:hypothetical protein